MTSAEKLAELRRHAEDLMLRRDAPRVVGTLVTIWSLIPGRMKRNVIGDLGDGLSLNDPEQIDGLLELVAGAALELRSDERPPADVQELRASARDLLAQVLPAS